MDTAPQFNPDSPALANLFAAVAWSVYVDDPVSYTARLIQLKRDLARGNPYRTALLDIRLLAVTW